MIRVGKIIKDPRRSNVTTFPLFFRRDVVKLLWNRFIRFIFSSVRSPINSSGLSLHFCSILILMLYILELLLSQRPNEHQNENPPRLDQDCINNWTQIQWSAVKTPYRAPQESHSTRLRIDHKMLQAPGHRSQWCTWLWVPTTLNLSYL